MQSSDCKSAHHLWFRATDTSDQQADKTLYQGALVAQAALTALQIPHLEDAHYTAYGAFIISLIVSLLATFFTWLQQRIYGLLEDADAIRCWLSDGVEANGSSETWLQSSIASHHAMEVPFELISISIMAFLAGLGIFLGSAVVDRVNLAAKGGNLAIFTAFLVITAFVLGLFCILLGGKEVEFE